MKLGDLIPTINILFLGDIVGKPGRWAVARSLPYLKRKYSADFVIANVENAAAGIGLTKQIAERLHTYGVNCLTGGNHIFDRKEVFPYFEEENSLVRPANYPSDVPGVGSRIFNLDDDTSIAVINLQGRIFMNPIDCPFKRAETEIDRLHEQTRIIIVDFHAEATSEKQAMAYHLDGTASAVIGTHTHVQSADERVLPGGTACITDVGMVGAHDSVIGIRKEDAMFRILTGLHRRFRVAAGDIKVCGVALRIDRASGRAVGIDRIRLNLPLRGDSPYRETKDAGENN